MKGVAQHLLSFFVDSRCGEKKLLFEAVQGPRRQLTYRIWLKSKTKSRKRATRKWFLRFCVFFLLSVSCTCFPPLLSPTVPPCSVDASICLVCGHRDVVTHECIPAVFLVAFAFFFSSEKKLGKYALWSWLISSCVVCHLWMVTL